MHSKLLLIIIITNLHALGSEKVLVQMCLSFVKLLTKALTQSIKKYLGCYDIVFIMHTYSIVHAPGGT